MSGTPSPTYVEGQGARFNRKKVGARMIRRRILADAFNACIPGRRPLTDQEKDGGVEKFEVHARALGIKAQGLTMAWNLIPATFEALIPIEAYPEIMAVLDAGGYF